ncbi:TniB family NTP-binding protein [Ruegeria profundi]|uniref:AAA+ ATPase domain-containing protein n=1 Tax=Ruegeria profundi TaxID=1685378 RepID=A0A0X3TPY9_9RHOB|nr:TniB family NTP-binding protein [Ruegeria profundi]KUJ77749.1 hypothetical protein AVO44_15570 [Ruegeria profundi]
MLDQTKNDFDAVLRDITIRHHSYMHALLEVEDLLTFASSESGGIIPILGPTRCGKTELLSDLKSRNQTVRRAPGMLLEKSDFVLGRVPARPNDRDLYVALLEAVGGTAGPKEKTSIVRERLFELISAFGIRVIALDEASHTAERGANLSARGAGDHFKTVVDQSGVVLVLAGLPRFQSLLDANEQFAARSMKTVVIEPYSWSKDEDRKHFCAAVNSAFQCLEQAGLLLDFDKEDLVRRLYGASGGRIGQVLKMLRASIQRLPGTALSLGQISESASKVMQSQVSCEMFFALDPPSDLQLVSAYGEVMEAAQLEVSPSTVQDLLGIQEQ